MPYDLQDPLGQAQFDLGFEHGAESIEDPVDIDFRSRVSAYQVGFIVGRSYSESVKSAHYRTMAETAGRLGARFGIALEDLLVALNISTEQQQTIRQAYVNVLPGNSNRRS